MNDKNLIKIVVAGDVADWNNPDFSNIDRDSFDKIKQADVFVFNLEGPICTPEKNIGFYYPYNLLTYFIATLFKKRQPVVFSSEAVLQKIPKAKINIACMANNHIKDRGLEGFKNTLFVLKKHNFLYVGAGLNSVKARKSLKLEIDGKKIAFVNSNYIGWNFRNLFFDIFGAKKNSFGANHLEWSKLNKEIKLLKKEGYHVMAILHCGKEMKPISNNLKNKLSEVAANTTIVHHQHYLEKLDLKNVYATGDFIFKAPHLPEKRGSRVLEFEL